MFAISNKLDILSGLERFVFVRRAVQSADVRPDQSDLQGARQKIMTAVAEHLPTLARRRMALIKIDAYGVVDANGWKQECQYFVDKVIRPRLTDGEAQAVADYGLNKLAMELIEEPARKECGKIELGFNYNTEMSPIEYEKFCAARLESGGWACELTKASGDQGADVIARKGGTILVIQCKKYGSPVGNGAVQEAIAAKSHLKAHFAAVVSNASFTRSAVELANSTRTLLLSHEELDIIDARLKSA
jgi:restriction system protein